MTKNKGVVLIYNNQKSNDFYMMSKSFGFFIGLVQILHYNALSKGNAARFINESK